MRARKIQPKSRQIDVSSLSAMSSWSAVDDGRVCDF